MLTPLVSVITINYNCQEQVTAHIESVRRQRFDSWEHIVVDCASTDQSVAAIKAAMHDQLRFFEIGFCGVAEARNFAISQARGSICAILDSDDYMLPNRLQLQTAILDTDKQAVAVGGGFIALINRTHPVLKRILSARKIFRMPATDTDITISIQSAISPVTHSALTFRKQVFEQLGGYSLTMEKSEDFDLIVRMSTVGKIGGLSEPVSMINFGRPGSHTTRHRPKKRDALYYAFFSLLRNVNDQQALGYTTSQLEEMLDQYELADLPLMQLKWLISNISHIDKSAYFRQAGTIVKKLLQQLVRNRGSLRKYNRLPGSALALIKASETTATI